MSQFVVNSFYKYFLHENCWHQLWCKRVLHNNYENISCSLCVSVSFATLTLWLWHLAHLVQCLKYVVSFFWHNTVTWTCLPMSPYHIHILFESMWQKQKMTRLAIFTFSIKFLHLEERGEMHRFNYHFWQHDITRDTVHWVVSTSN